MNTDLIVFIAVVFFTFFNNALHWYTQLTTYPLFAWVGRKEFLGFHLEYQRRLPFSIYAPYSLLMISTLLLFVFRPAQISSVWVISLTVLNAAIMFESLIFAAPIHKRLDAQEFGDETRIRQLIRYNGVRVVTSSVSSIAVLYLLTKVLS